MRRRGGAAMRGTQQAGVDRPIGFDTEFLVDDPADGTEHRVVPWKKDGDPFADMQRGGSLAADAGFGHITNGDIELSESRAGERRLDQTRLTRLALVGGRERGWGSLGIRHARLNIVARPPRRPIIMVPADP